MIAFEIAECDEFDPNQHVEDTAKKQAIQQETISDKDVNALCSLIEKKGVTNESVLDRYHVNTFDELTFSQFNSAMKILNSMKDKEA